MSGEFNAFECPRCKGTCEVIGVGLWDDLEVCPQCDGTGEVYEYVPGVQEADEELLPEDWELAHCPTCGRCYGTALDADRCVCDESRSAQWWGLRF